MTITIVSSIFRGQNLIPSKQFRSEAASELQHLSYQVPLTFLRSSELEKIKFRLHSINKLMTDSTQFTKEVEEQVSLRVNKCKKYIPDLFMPQTPRMTVHVMCQPLLDEWLVCSQAHYSWVGATPNGQEPTCSKCPNNFKSRL